jgi:ubiquinone/menaquinone biosynthesis C-methylase UbiE
MPLDLEYGRRVYDRWGRHPRLYLAADWATFLGRQAEIRRQAVDALGLERGEAVLEIACGPGVNFALVEQAIGTSGTLTALDYSQEMLASARKHARVEGWQNIDFVQGDAARAELPAASFDAALCTLGLSVIPDHRAAIDRVLDALKGGGRFVVLDGRLVRGPGRFLNPALKQLVKYVSNADPDRNLDQDLKRTFDEVSLDRFDAVSLFIATARKAPGKHGPPTGGPRES